MCVGGGGWGAFEHVLENGMRKNERTFFVLKLDPKKNQQSLVSNALSECTMYVLCYCMYICIHDKLTLLQYIDFLLHFHSLHSPSPSLPPPGVLSVCLCKEGSLECACMLHVWYYCIQLNQSVKSARTINYFSL